MPGGGGNQSTEDREPLQYAVAQLALSGRAETLVTVDALVQFARLTMPTSPVRESQIVENEEVAWPQRHLDLDIFDTETVVLKEREFGANAVELHSTEKIRGNLHARKTW
jgi:hypothetical protein